MTSSVIVVNPRSLDRVPAGYTRIYMNRSTSYKPEYGADFSVLEIRSRWPRATRATKR